MVTIPHQSAGETAGPFGGLGDDGDGQGEVVVLPLRFVIAPDHGRFHPASLVPGGEGMLVVEVGTRIGEVRNGTLRYQVHSPFGGQVDLWLVWDGQLVATGQPLCSLTPPTTTITAAGG